MTSALIGLLPWALTALMAVFVGLMAWKVGVPAVKLAFLDQQVKALRYELKTQQLRADLCDEKNTELTTRLDKLTTDLEEANRHIRSLVDVIELKAKLGALADKLQPEAV